MTVTTLKPRASQLAPERQRLADLRSRIAALGDEMAALQEPATRRAQALAELPAAEEALKALLLDEALGEVDGAALEAAKTRVRTLRRQVAETPDNGARLAELNGKAAQFAAAHEAAQRVVVMAEVARLTATYQKASKLALAAEAALNGLASHGRAMPDPALGGELVTACSRATKLHTDLQESAIRSDALGKVLTSVSAAWAAFPAALANDPSAQPEPLEAAVALLPVRDEEHGEVADAAA